MLYNSNSEVKDHGGLEFQIWLWTGMNVTVYISFKTCVKQNCFEGEFCTFNFQKYCQFALHRDHTDIYSHQPCTRETVILFITNNTVLSQFDLCQFGSLKWYLIIELICISFFVNHIQYLFIWLRVIHISFFVNYLLTFFVHFVFSCTIAF